MFNYSENWVWSSILEAIQNHWNIRYMISGMQNAKYRGLKQKKVLKARLDLIGLLLGMFHNSEKTAKPAEIAS